MHYLVSPMRFRPSLASFTGNETRSFFKAFAIVQRESFFTSAPLYGSCDDSRALGDGVHALRPAGTMDFWCDDDSPSLGRR